MEIGKLYKIKWQGRRVALRRTPNGKVEFLEFIPNRK